MNKRVVVFNSYDYGSTGTLCSALKNEKLGFDRTIFVCSDKRNSNTADYYLYEHCSKVYRYLLGKKAYFLCRYGFLGKRITRKCLRYLHKNIDFSSQKVAFNLHQLESSYFDLEEIIKFAKKHQIKIFITLHDCWIFTGKCPHYQISKCYKWMNSGCYRCDYNKAYPPSFSKRIAKSFVKKISILNSYSKNIVYICPSSWIDRELNNSMLKITKSVVINNGIKIPGFIPANSKNNKKIHLLCVSNEWTVGKGAEYIEYISNELDYNRFSLTVVGNKNRFFKNITPNNKATFIDRLEKTDLFKLYPSFDYLINPTLEDNFPTINIEALSYGLKVITFNTGGSPEIIDRTTGIVCGEKTKESLLEVIMNLSKNTDRKKCFERALALYSDEIFIESYYNLFDDEMDK